MKALGAERLERRAAGRRPVRCHLARRAAALQRIAAFAVGLHQDLVDRLAPVGGGPKAIDAPAPDLGGEHRAEAAPPKPDRLAADVDAARVRQVLVVA
ncbi:MAG: hypothetical protein AAGI51_14110 [Pseudomonadota bacterium]